MFNRCVNRAKASAVAAAAASPSANSVWSYLNNPRRAWQQRENPSYPHQAHAAQPPVAGRRMLRSEDGEMWRPDDQPQSESQSQKQEVAGAWEGCMSVPGGLAAPRHVYKVEFLVEPNAHVARGDKLVRVQWVDQWAYLPVPRQFELAAECEGDVVEFNKAAAEEVACMSVRSVDVWLARVKPADSVDRDRRKH